MELACKFGLAYIPMGKVVDPVVRRHVANCADCQDQVAII